MKKCIFILFLLFTSFSCRTEVEKPDNLIPREEMKSILKDIYVYKQMRNYKLDNNLPDATTLYVGILKNHGLTPDEFKTSYDYYVINDAAYDELLIEIKSELEAELPEDILEPVKN